MITRQTAADLFKYQYRLVDKEGNKYDILHPRRKSLVICDENLDSSFRDIIDYEIIGIEYFILARPLDSLTKEITHEGKKFVPKDEFFIRYGGGVSISAKTYWVDEFVENILYTPLQKLEYEIVNLLHEWHFNIGFPPGTVSAIEK